MSDEKISSAATDEVDINAIAEQPHVEFGLHLAIARKAAGLTTLDVAERLKLHEDMIKALEASRLDILPPAAFTQGYIKAYAKLLKISAEEIMRDYDVMVPNKAASLVVASGVPAEHSSRDMLMKVTSYGMGVLALILFVFWIQQSGFELSGNLVGQIEKGDLSLTGAQQDKAATHTDTEADTDAAADINMPGETMYSPAIATTVIPPPTVNVPADKKETVTEKQTSGFMQEAKREEPKAEPKPVIRPAAPPINKVVAAVEPKPENTNATAADDIIKLSATTESWAEVQDADNNRLFYSLIKVGDTHAIKGRAPFKVFLGNAPSVSVVVNDQTVDISRYVRPSKIAHVKINARASAQFGGARDTQQVTDQYIPETPAGASRTE